ncbi:CDP-alcohol phosphatidyltransferase family protein [Methanobacterium alkalithermotolerans]|uniref:CDP-alcohol phosphatidyltransferase family protein n=1 Tax=Methanobacterium alkalithermotolerans TaxID=2731220 RepID=A0A8T8K6I0_9EURY|nr:CDP-alcohol phosphatidyltransferase family protein [Methanobacterium alkalithermotolerans]QUH22723.1 CDP-alcohol phosphatidyltransferase family protein [Methanobacterium alkalithermotolerans]
MKIKIIFKKKLPHILSLLRIAAAPVWAYLFLNGLYIYSIILFIMAICTDFLDGYLARKLNLSSNKGAYLDVTADFIFISTCFLGMGIKGWYPLLLPLILLVMFSLFIMSSTLKKLIYDPAGKFFGSFLMIVIFLSLIFPYSLLWDILLILVLAIASLSLFYRFRFLIRQKRANS